MLQRALTVFVCLFVFVVAPAPAATAQQLEIHYINVGWGNSVLVRGQSQLHEHGGADRCAHRRRRRESTGWDLPRIDVVEHVLGAQATACVTAPPALVPQTEESNPAGSLTSFAGFTVGDIMVTTDASTVSPSRRTGTFTRASTSSRSQPMRSTSTPPARFR
jgi:hypothetical protein